MIKIFCEKTGNNVHKRINIQGNRLLIIEELAHAAYFFLREIKESDNDSIEKLFSIFIEGFLLVKKEREKEIENGNTRVSSIAESRTL